MDTPEKMMETEPTLITWDELVVEARRDICFFDHLIKNPGEALSERNLTMSEEDLARLTRMHLAGEWQVDRSVLSQQEAEEAVADQKEIAGIAAMASRGRWKK